jgi:DNA-binding NtrC family response regulator
VEDVDRCTIRLVDENGETRPLSELRREIIQKTVLREREFGFGFMSRTARALGIGRSTLYRKSSKPQ